MNKLLTPIQKNDSLFEIHELQFFISHLTKLPLEIQAIVCTPVVTKVDPAVLAAKDHRYRA